jgi:hypothetical protein
LCVGLVELIPLWLGCTVCQALSSTTLISGTRGVKTGIKGCPKRHLLHRVDHVTVSRFFLVCAVKCHFTTFAGPKYRKPKMASHDLRARSFEDGCLCSILHGPLQLQIWTAFLLPARLFPTAVRQSATQLCHTTFSQLSEPTQGSSSTCTLLFPFPARFSALHCSPHLRDVESGPTKLYCPAELLLLHDRKHYTASLISCRRIAGRRSCREDHANLRAEE